MGTPEGSRELDRILDRRLTFLEKLEWLEEAETLSLHLEAARLARGAASLKVAEDAGRRTADDRRRLCAHAGLTVVHAYHGSQSRGYNRTPVRCSRVSVKRALGTDLELRKQFPPEGSCFRMPVSV